MLPPNTQPQRRVAWIISHTTLREFEVPLIRSLGLEVYTTKLLSNDPDFGSASADYADDQHSSLPKDALDCLNQHNFYDAKITPDVANTLNTYFGAVIAIPFKYTVSQLIQHYKGRLLFRAFGREAPYNYTELLRHYAGNDILERIQPIQHRFWLAPCYDPIPLIEDPLIRNRSVVLPLGLPDRLYNRQNSWTGADPRLLFVCPRIASHPYYYGRIYKNFKRDLGDFPHLIAGAQPKPVNDPNVLGFLNAQQYETLYRNSRVMYYHSREPRHLHYHPVEAMIYGMPVIYMKGGLLESFGGPDQPGACDSTNEARHKIQRVLDNDAPFINHLRSTQNTILQKFTADYCRPFWQERFLRQILSTPLQQTAAA